MNAYHILALLLDPSLILAAQAMTPDPWQRDLLLCRDPYLLLNCARQTGKSTTVAALALHRLLTVANSLVLVVAPAERQSHELFRKVLDAYHALGQPVAAIKSNQSELELGNGSRLVALPEIEIGGAKSQLWRIWAQGQRARVTVLSVPVVNLSVVNCGERNREV